MAVPTLRPMGQVEAAPGNPGQRYGVLRWRWGHQECGRELESSTLLRHLFLQLLLERSDAVK